MSIHVASTSTKGNAIRAAAMLRRFIYRRLIYLTHPVARSARLAGGIKLIVEPKRRWIDWNLIVRGEYEPGTVSLINRFLRPGGTFVDVGANIGLLSVRAAKKTGSDGLVYAFEPDPVNYSRLAWARAANEVPWLLPIPLGVGAAPDRARLWNAPSGDGGLSSLIALDGFKPAGSIEVTSLDTFFRSVEPGRVELVKIDVEGFEEQVVRGASEFLERHRPAIIVEMTTEGAVRAGKLLLERGFESFVTEGKSVRNTSRLRKCPPCVLEADNMIFVPAEKVRSLHSIGLEVDE